MSELIIFTLSEEFYGIEVTKVREIKTYETPTPLPNTQPFVQGVINIRGEIVPVIDLHRRFDSSITPLYTDTTLIITTKTSDGRMVAIIVDAIDALANFNPHTLIDLSNDALFINRKFLQGVADIDHRHVLVIDIDTLFSFEEINSY